MSKQTAVQWLTQRLHNRRNGIYDGHPDLSVQQLCEIALVMEREQMIEFTDNYVDNCVFPNENNAIPTTMDVPHYYDVTYGKEAGHEA